MNVAKPVRLKQAVDGLQETVDSVPGDLAIYPAYLSQQFHWDKEAEFFNLFLEPSFLTTVGYDVFGSDRLELIPHLATLFDPLVQQIGFALKTSLEIDGKNSNLYADSIADAFVVHLLSRYSTNSRQIKTITGGFTQQQWNVAIWSAESLEFVCEGVSLVDRLHSVRVWGFLALCHSSCIAGSRYLSATLQVNDLYH